MPRLLQWFLILFLFSSCNDLSESKEVLRRNQKGEFLYRLSNEVTAIEPMVKVEREVYPWDNEICGGVPKLTKEFFRCNGSQANAVKIEVVRGEIVRNYDCGGAEKHSLPLRDGKEFIYPVLIDLLNYIQVKTGKRVWITSGHRCPEHNTYVDSSPSNQYSKHMIGAEVSFYVKGLEIEPGYIVKLIFDYYNQPIYKDLPEYREFSRYDKPDTDVSIQPWFNKEIFIKLYAANEGRDYDNRHPYPYIAIQVRHDRDRQERVAYSWDQAWRNYMRF